MNRTDIRNHYGKCAAMLGFLHCLLVFAAACIAVYAADFDELKAETGNAVLVRNGLYVVLVVGLIFSLLELVGSLLLAKKGSEGAMSYQRFVTFITCFLMAVAAVLAVLVLRNGEIDWDSEKRAMLSILLVAGLIGTCMAAAIFMCCIKGLKYYDRGKKLAKDVSDREEGSYIQTQIGISFLCTGILNLSVSFLCFFFSNMIKNFEKTHQGFYMCYRILFLIGVLMVLEIVFAAFLNVRSSGRNTKGLNRITAIANQGYLLVFSFAGIFSLGQDFVKNDSPDSSYFIFSFILVIISSIYILLNIKRINKKDL